MLSVGCVCGLRGGFHLANPVVLAAIRRSTEANLLQRLADTPAIWRRFRSSKQYVSEINKRRRSRIVARSQDFQ